MGLSEGRRLNQQEVGHHAGDDMTAHSGMWTTTLHRAVDMALSGMTL